MGLTLFPWFPMIVSQIWLVFCSYYYYYLSHYRGIPNVVFPRKLSCCWTILEICLTHDRMVQRPLTVMGQTISSVFPKFNKFNLISFLEILSYLCDFHEITAVIFPFTSFILRRFTDNHPMSPVNYATLSRDNNIITSRPHEGNVGWWMTWTLTSILNKTQTI